MQEVSTEVPTGGEPVVDHPPGIGSSVQLEREKQG